MPQSGNVMVTPLCTSSCSSSHSRSEGASLWCVWRMQQCEAHTHTILYEEKGNRTNRTKSKCLEPGCQRLAVVSHSRVICSRPVRFEPSPNLRKKIGRTILEIGVPGHVGVDGLRLHVFVYIQELQKNRLVACLHTSNQHGQRGAPRLKRKIHKAHT